MKFIIDEQLPYTLCDFLRAQGYDAVHVNALRSGQRMSDETISERSIAEKRVVISKDIDFLKRFLIKQEPYKLLFVTTGNIKNSQLLALFETNFSILLRELSINDVVEISQTAIVVLI
ncbi:MAG: DUF5615 family PIN-like protein [Saprospiraceae bacterium]|jgi:predicted nuclease of predicted toxin-antitoxin system|nr:DUF5615 family PIN-like protein [Saprospiraceae bacterium]